MDDLVKAIDRAVEFVRQHPDWMTRSEVEEFHRLAKTVYLIALNAGLVGALPQVPELRPQLESNDPPLKPVQFESKLNLPGDWDSATPSDTDALPSWRRLTDELSEETPQPVFLVHASPRWFDDMEVLRELAAKAAIPSRADTKPVEDRLKVDLARKTVTLDGAEYDVSSVQALRWIKVLVEHSGEWISGAGLEEYDAELIGVQPHKLKRKLPAEVLDLIESQTGAGSRIRLGRK